jgi:ribonucleoside-triphosphate reductase
MINIQVRKDDGSLEKFAPDKIYASIVKETGCSGDTILQIVNDVQKIISQSNLSIITGPLIREIVNSKFIENGLLECQRKYTRVGLPIYDARLIDLGGGKGDNANLQNNAETSHKRKADALSKEQYLLMLPPHLFNAHINGDIHIHDLEYFGNRQFCFDGDIRYFFKYGFAGDGSGEHTSFAAPANRPEVALLHAVKVLGSSQTNCAGGQGFYNFLTFIAPYFEGEPYETFYQCMQMFIYEMTQMLVARGGQVIFSSVQLTPGVPSLWKDKPVVYRGKVWDGIEAPLRVYGEFEREVRLLFKAMMEVMIEGDYQGKPFYFPKPEIGIETQFLTDPYETDSMRDKSIPLYKDLYLLAFELASKFGTPYFDNMIPNFRGNGEGISCFQCCAYCFQSNSKTDSDFNDKLFFKNGKHFSMGSYQVATLNLPRYAHESEGDLSKFIELAKQNIDLCCEVFHYKEKWTRECNAPFLGQIHDGSQYCDFDSLVFTIGIVGINEVCHILFGKELHEDKETQKSALKICLELKKYCHQKSSEIGKTIAFSRTPAETTAQRFAVLDLLTYGNAHKYVKGNVKEAIKTYAESGERQLPVYYTNGTNVRVDANISIVEKIQIEQSFFPILDGGNICNIYLGEARPDPRGLMDMTFNICKSTNLGYFAFTRDFTVNNKRFKVYNIL